MPELAAELAGHGTIVTPSAISRWLIRNGYRFEKNVAGQRTGSARDRQSPPEMETQRLPRMQLEPHRLVFIDETGTTTKMVRMRARCPKG